MLYKVGIAIVILAMKYMIKGLLKGKDFAVFTFILDVITYYQILIKNHVAYV